MKKEQKLWSIYLVAVLAMLFWGLAFIWVKQVYMLGFRPITVVFFRLIIASILLNIGAKLIKSKEKIDKKDYKLFFLIAFFEPFCYFLGESFGMLFVSSSLASIIVSTIPLITPFFAWFFLREKVNKYEVIGLIVSFAGVFIILIEDFQLGGSPLGIALMFFAVLSGTSYGIVLRKLTHNYGPLTITRIQTVIGMMLFLPLFLLVDLRSLGQGQNFSQALPLFLLLGALPSSLSFLFLAIAVKKIGIIRTNIFSNLIPVFTALLAFHILNEEFSGYKIFAMLIVISGLFLSQVQKYKSIYQNSIRRLPEKKSA